MSTPISLGASRTLGPSGLIAPKADPASLGLAPARQGERGAQRGSEAAQKLVATTFIKPILKQAREMNDAPPPFGPTQAEKQFGALLDNKIADDIAASMDLAITDRMAREMDERSRALSADAPAPDAPARRPGGKVDLIG